MTFKPGDKVTEILDGRVHCVFTVERIRGHMVCGPHVEADERLLRHWQPGDDGAAQHQEDIATCRWFQRWDALSAEDAATVAAILRQYGRGR